MSNQAKVRHHSFQPGAMSIIQMGEELIGHPTTAINELVKNGYDADALNCKVYFNYPKNAKGSFAIIYDNGIGMDNNILFGDWLKPSVSAKRKQNAKSEVYNRSLLGSKGIGRLATMALGDTITVITKKEYEKRFNWITVNRRAFKEETLLAKISFPGDQIADYYDLFKQKDYLEERKSPENYYLLDFLKKAQIDLFSKGTLIIIESLDDAVLKILHQDYNQVELLEENIEPFKNTEFYKGLATLITPINLNQGIQQELVKKGIINNEKVISDNNSTFSVDYGTNLMPDMDEKEIEWQKIDPIPVQSAYDYRVYGKVTCEGNVKGFLAYQRLDDDIFEEQFNLSKEESDESKGGLLNLFEEKQNNDTGEYYFDIRVYDIGEKDNLEKLAKFANFNSGAKFKRAFKQFQGLRVSKNGFGVKPYGIEVEDWIGLSKRRVQRPGQTVNTNQILGYIFFYSPQNDNLEEKTNREGFQENNAFIQVKNTLNYIFKNLGQRRYNYRLLHGLGRIPSSKHQRPDFEKFVKTLNQYNASNQIINYSEKFMKEVTTSMDNLEESLSFSERLASLGSGIELVYHELAQPLSALQTTKSSLNLKKKKIQEDALKSYITDINTLVHTTDVIVELRKSLQPAIGRSRKKKFKPYHTFLKVCNLFTKDIEEYNIQIVADERLKERKIVDLEFALWISFLNIINNAVYWIKKSGRNGEIRFHMEGDNIVISNSGPFINVQIIEYIFDYGVTTRQEKNATGLGLAFTQSILSKNNWEIFAENRENGPAFIIKKVQNE